MESLEKRKKKRQEEVVPLFEDEQTDKRLKEKWQHTPIVIGNTFLLEEIEEEGLDIKGYLDYKGWTQFVSMKEPVYPKLVRGFYAGAFLKKENFSIESKIKGKTMVLIELYVGAALGMESLDGATYQGYDWYDSIPIQKGEVV